MNGTIFGVTLARALTLVTIVMVALAWPASQRAVAAPTGECVTARINAPFRLPDGLIYPAGALTLCDSGTFSPVDDLQRILVSGSSIGLFVSRKRTAESGSMDAPEILLNRDADGNLELIGYTMPTSGRNVAYRLKSQGETWQATYRRRLGASPPAPIAAIIATAGSR